MITDKQLSDREIKALQIAAKHKLTRKGNVWFVPSQAGHGEYEVRPDPQAPRCTCPDYEFRNARCKHIVAVEYVLMREYKPDGSMVITETVKVTRKTYTQDWTAYNTAQTREKSELQALLYELCRNVSEPEKRKGRGRPQLSLSDMIFSSTYKVYSTVSGRRFSTDLREAKARGYLSRLPHYNSVFRYLESEALTPYLKELITVSARPLQAVESDFAVDSSGFSTGQFMRWFDVKYGEKEDRRMWLKLHLICGVKTNIVTSVQVTDGYAHDYHYFKPLVNQTAEGGFKMKEVSADKAYLGAENLLTPLRHGAIPYIPFKSNSVPHSGGSYGPKSELWTRMYHFYSLNRAQFLQHYHKRSNIETTFHMIKSKFKLREISADKGYLGASNMLATLQHGAIPYILFKSNSVPHSGGSYGPKSELWTRMYHFYALNRPQFLEHYHKRSNIETTFHMIKSTFGRRLRSRTLTAQINEALCKVLCHNLCVVIQSVHELGIEAAFEAAQPLLNA